MALIKVEGEEIITGAPLARNAYKQGGGTQKYMHYDPATKTARMVKTQDCTPIYEECQRRRNAGNKANELDYGYHLGDIPETTLERWVAESGLQPNQHREIMEMVVKKMRSGEHNEMLVYDDKKHQGNSVKNTPIILPRYAEPAPTPAKKPKNFLANPLGG